MKVRKREKARESTRFTLHPGLSQICELVNPLLGVYLPLAAKRILTNGRVKKGKRGVHRRRNPGH